MQRPHIHLINPLRNAFGGSERRTVNLADQLRNRANVTIWSTGSPDPPFDALCQTRKISAQRLMFPKTGTFVFVGIYFSVGRWIWLTRPSRVILVYNTPDLTRLHERLALFSRAFRGTPEIIYASEMMRKEADLPGLVEPSLFDLARFEPSERPANAKFTIGRLSRAVAEKHHPNDVAFYRVLASHGCSISVMGATQPMIADLPPNLHGEGDISLLPTGAMHAESFLRGLDCFFYRTAESWREPWGRVVLEAMSCGLPVVAERRGGYSEIIDHGRNGFLFDNESEALSMLLRLKGDPVLCKSVGAEARRTTEMILSSDARSRIVDFYIERPKKHTTVSRPAEHASSHRGLRRFANGGTGELA